MILLPVLLLKRHLTALVNGLWVNTKGYALRICKDTTSCDCVEALPDSVHLHLLLAYSKRRQ